MNCNDKLIEIASKIMECEMLEKLVCYSRQASGKVLVKAMELSALEWEAKTGLSASARPDWIRDMVREFAAWSHRWCAGNHDTRPDDENYYAWEAYFQSVPDGTEDPEMIRALVETGMLDPLHENCRQELPIEVYLDEGGTDPAVIDMLLPRNEKAKMVFSARIYEHQKKARRLSRQAEALDAMVKRFIAEFDARSGLYRYPKSDASDTPQD